MTTSTINNNQTTTEFEDGTCVSRRYFKDWNFSAYPLEEENEQLKLIFRQLNYNFFNDSRIADDKDINYNISYRQYYTYYETINRMYEHPEEITAVIDRYETRIEKLEEDKKYLNKKLDELEDLVPNDGESIEDLRNENELLRLEKQNLEEENEELRNTNIADREIRMLRQTIRQQMQTIASLQMQLNQNRINRDSFNPMEDIEE